MSTSTVKLASLVRECASSGVGRRAMLLRADRLPPALARPHHLRLAEAALAPLLRADRALAFHMPGPRIAVVWRGEAEDAVLDAVGALRTLLSDAAPDAPPLTDIVALYDLPDAADLLLAAISDAPATPVAAAPPLPTTPLDAATLAVLEARLAQADISHFARRRTVWQLGPGMDVTPAWEHRHLSAHALAADLAPDRDVTADPWLFRRLTRTLDRRMLSLLAAPGELARAGPFGLSLNVASILSPEFLRFDDTLPAGLRSLVVLDLMAADVLTDPAAFAFARDFARARRYRLMLRGATMALAQVLDLAALDLDGMQVPWSPGLPEEAEALRAYGVGRVVLHHADSAASLAWARAAGIGLVQGDAPDGLARTLGVRGLGERATAA